MKKRYVKIMALIIAMSMIGSIFASCKKGGDDSAQASTTSAKTTTQAKSSATTSTGGKTTTTASPTTNKQDGTAAAGQNDGATRPSENSGNNEQQGNTGGNEGSGSTENDPGFNPISEEKVYDLKGREIRFIIWRTDEHQAYPVNPDPNNKLNNVRYHLLKEAEEKFNCKFVFEQPVNTLDQIKQIFETDVLSGTHTYDGYRLQLIQVFPKHEKNNALLVLNDYIDFSQPIWQK